MQVDQLRFTEEGYNTLRNVVPTSQLESLRTNIEHMVNRRKEISAQRRLPNEPRGGAWEASAQPRLKFDTDCDDMSASAIEFLLHENTLGVSQQLMAAEHVVPHQFGCICSGSKNAGPMRWHRDVGPGEPAPLRGMISNMDHHGPSYLQWNIALYDDSVFWIVPRSHRRTNTDEENRQLAENPSVPLPGGMPVELNAGDGVVYTHLLLHWGSYYSSKMRRTLHPGSARSVLLPCPTFTGDTGNLGSTIIFPVRLDNSSRRGMHSFLRNSISSQRSSTRSSTETRPDSSPG